MIMLQILIELIMVTQRVREQLDPWENDPDFIPQIWVNQVINGDTRLGYLDWVLHMRGSEDE